MWHRYKPKQNWSFQMRLRGTDVVGIEAFLTPLVASTGIDPESRMYVLSLKMVKCPYLKGPHNYSTLCFEFSTFFNQR